MVKEEKMIFEWKDDYSVTIESIDVQHKKLFQILNHLHKSLSEQKSDTDVNKTLKEMEAYTICHFDLEENLMNENGFEKFEEHKKEYEFF